MRTPIILTSLLVNFLFLASVVSASIMTTVGGEIILMSSNGPGKNLRSHPAVAYGQEVYCVVWQEGWSGKNGQSRIFAARVTRSGILLDSSGVEVSPCTTGIQERPRIAYNEGVFLVVWQDMRNNHDADVLGVRLTAEGKVLDASPIPIGQKLRTQVNPDVVAGKKGFMVVYQSFEGSADYANVIAVPIDKDGTIGAAVNTKGSSSPKIGFDGKNYLVQCNLLYTKTQLNGLCLLDSNGNVLSKVLSVNAPALTVAGIGSDNSAICGLPGKGGWLLVRERAKSTPWGWGGPSAQRCVTVTPDGKVDSTVPYDSYPQSRLANWLDTGPGTGSPYVGGLSALAWDGEEAVAVWMRWHVTSGYTYYDADLMASRVSGWRPTDLNGVSVAASSFSEEEPSLASDGAGGLLCVYKKKPSSGGGTAQIAGRFLSAPPDSVAIESPTIPLTGMSISAWPSPFQPQVTITVSGSDEPVGLKIFDVSGSQVADLSGVLRQAWNKGLSRIVWDAGGRASGAYIVKLKTGSAERKLRIFLMR